MRIYKTLYRRYRLAALILLGVFLTGTLNAQNKAKKVTAISVTMKVTDEAGKPMPKAQVVVGEGMIHAVTDQNGEIAFKASPEDFVTVSAPGYEKKVSLVGEISNENTISLVKSKLMMTSDDVIPLPFVSLKKRQLTGSSVAIKGSVLDRYPSTDIRNAFTGLVNGLEVRENNGSPGLSAEEELGVFGIGEKINVSSRGRNMMYIIDEIPTDITEMPLDPEEIESMTVVKDIVAKSMYGPAAADGIIFIKTKRGRTNERILKVNMESGVSSIDRMPEWVSGADYARLNNQARTNSGLSPLYDEQDIAAYSKNDPYDMYHPSVNFKDILLKNTMSFRRANVSSSGGTDKVQYYTYLGYDGEGDIYKVGPIADYNRLNTRANIDIKINDFIKVQFDFFGGLTYRRSNNYGFDTDFTTEGTTNSVLTITEFPSLINDITSIPPIAFPVYANNDPALKTPWYAVNSNYGTNPVGNVMKNGYYTESGRTGAFNVALDYDMSSIVKGLKSRTYIGFNAFNLLRIGKAEDYIAYIATPGLTSSGADTITLKKVHDGVDQADQAKLHDYYYERFAVYENLNYQKTFGKSDLQVSGTYFLSKISQNGIEEPKRQQTGILTGIYSYDDKYSIQGVLNYAGSSSYDTDSRYFLSPTIGASWVISEENFLKDVKFIDYLKLRGEVGVLGYESFLSPFYYRDRWNYNSSGSAFGPYSTNQWFGSATDNTVYRTSPNRIGNPDITWEKRREINAGIDALLFDRKLSVEVNYYNQLRDGVISQVANTLPYLAGISSTLPRFNYSQYRYYGVEAGIQYTDDSHDLKYSIGGNFTVQNSRVEKFDEPSYRYDYQYRAGQPLDVIRGQTYLGKFASDEEAMQVPQLYDDVLHAGDLKYKDMNGDGVVDDNDQSKIGHSTPRLVYAVNLKLSYKDVDLTVVGAGRAFYDLQQNSQYFWNGWGDNTYSAFVRDNIGGAYPKLTYYKVNNNFVGSNFWLIPGGFFKIQNAELAWNVPVKGLQWSGVRGFRVFARGANLLTFSKVKDVDPESINSGVENYPLFRTFTGGIKLTF